ncbi:MAG: hypothetical protein H7840_10210 [Alphaproteobacteria bacterium]
MRPLRRWLLPFAVVGMLAVALAACYLPDDFKAEIRIGADGAYGITYEGYLTWVPLYTDIRDRKLSPKEAAEKIAGIEHDLKRDSGFKEIRSLGNGQFRVRYDRQGRFTRGESEMITFVRRNALILYVKMDKNNRVTIAGNMPQGDRARDLVRLGLGVNGQLRVTTGAYVSESNAQTVGKHGPFRTYDWQIKPTDRRAPKLVIDLK